MTTLQRGICLGCIAVAIAAAIATGLLINPQAPASEPEATPNAPQAAQPEPQSAAAPAIQPAKAETQSQTQNPNQAQTPSAPQPQGQAQQTPSHTEQPQTSGSDATPPVRVEPSTYDFGIKNPDELVWTKFKVHNTTDQTLFIRNVHPSCKCTVPTLDSKILPPKGEINIEASVDLRGHLGEVRKNFKVFFEGYTVPVECVIKGVLSYPVQIAPDRPVITAIPRDLTGQLHLKSLDGRPFHVCAINGTEPTVLFKNSRDDAATEWRIKYELDPKLTRDQLPYMMLVETDHPGARMLDLKISGTINSKRELQWIKLWKSIFVNRNNVGLGVIPKGSYAEFETSVVRPDHTTPCEVSFKSRMFDDLTPIPSAADDGELSVEVVSVEPVDGRPKDEMYTVRVTNHSDENKVIQQPVYFHSGDVESRLWIGARLIPSPDDAPCVAD